MTSSSSRAARSDTGPRRRVKILLVKLGHLGDTLLLTPTLDLLAKEFPGARLDVMVRGGCETLLQGHPAITNLIPVASPDPSARTPGRALKEFFHAFTTVFARRYDYAFALTESDRAAFWTCVSSAKVRGVNDAYATLGWKRRLFNRVSQFDWAREHQVLRDFSTVAEVVRPGAAPGPLSFFPQADGAELRRKLPFLQTTRHYAVIHPTSRWAFKEWPAERWAAVADGMQAKHGLAVVFSTGPGAREQEQLKAIRATGAANATPHHATEGKLSLHELALLQKRARLFLGVDTVAMHLAAAMQTPTVALFGPSSEWSWRPWQCRHEVVLGACPCKAARQFTCDKSQPYPCMEKITVDAVLAAADRLLAPA